MMQLFLLVIIAVLGWQKLTLTERTR